MSKYIVGVDLGGTRIRAALFDQNLNILKRVETLTQADEGLDSVLERIKAQIQAVIPDDPSQVLGIGVSAPGPLNPEIGVLYRPVNLQGWENVPLGDILHNTFGLPVYIGNDANLAALAEATLGAGKGFRHLIYITVSTGIGSGIIVDGKLLLGNKGMAGEAGHMIMLVEDRVSSLEDEAAGPDMSLQAQKRKKAGALSIISDMVNKDLSKITGSIVGDAAQNGDHLALEIITRSGTIIGLGIVTLLHLFSPEIIIIGGGVAKLGDLIFKPMYKAIEQNVIDDAYYKDLIIMDPALGEDVSIFGAGVLVATELGISNISGLMEQRRK
jgi:glucokinase